MALRGDAPKDEPDAVSDIGSAAELVQLILRVQQEREPFDLEPVIGRPGASRIRGRKKPVRVAVAAFPNGHPRDTRSNQDLDALLAKQVAGASLAVTQLFWRADDYLSYVERARAHGVTIDILPGVMPVTNVLRLDRLVELTDVPAPAELRSALENASDAATASAIGIEFSAQLSAAVLNGGAPGLHLYTFNQHQAPLATLELTKELTK